MLMQDRKNTAFMAGQEFARSYPSSLQEMQTHWNVSANNGVIHNGCHSDKTGNSDKTNHNNKDALGSSTDAATKKEQVPPPQGKKRWGDDMMQQLKRRLVDLTESHTEQRETALNFMAGMMDEFTHLGNFSIPVDPNLIVIVVAKSDAYIPRDSVISLKELWPGAQVRVLDAGHIGAFLFKQHTFR